MMKTFIPPFSAAIVNLTPHRLDIIDADGNTVSIEPTGNVVRCQTSEEVVGSVNGITISRTTYGEVQGLPEPIPGVVYVVSALVRLAVPHRQDVYSPGPLIRNDQGQPVGCKGLSTS